MDALTGTLTSDGGSEQAVCLVPGGRSVGPDWACDLLPALDDGEAAVLRDRPGFARLRREGTAPWAAVGGPETGAAKRTLVAVEKRWQSPRFDGTVDFTVDGAVESGVTMGDPDRGDLGDLGMWELLSGMREGETVDFRPRGGGGPLRVSLDGFSAPQEAWQLHDAAARAEFAGRLRAEGTAAVRAGRLEFGVKKYERALPFAEGFPELQAALHLNLAAVALRTGDWSAVVQRCDRVLAGPDRHSARARLRRGKALMELGRLDLARSDLRRIPDDAEEHGAARIALRRLASLEAAEDARLRPVCRAMLG